MKTRVNDENDTWREFRRAGRERAHKQAWRDHLYIVALVAAHRVKCQAVTVIADGGHTRLTHPVTNATVDIYLTRGTVVHGDRRLPERGLHAALRRIGVDTAGVTVPKP